MGMRLVGYVMFILAVSFCFIADAWLGTYYLEGYRDITRQDVDEAFEDMNGLFDIVTSLAEFEDNGI